MTTKTPREGKKRVRVIIDSNAFFVPLRFRIDIFEELRRLLNAKPQLILLSAAQKELEKLREKGSPKMRREADFALRFAEKCTLYSTEEMSERSADDVIVEIAGRWKSPVFTNDRELRKRLRDINVPVIYVKQKSHLATEGMIQPV